MGGLGGNTGAFLGKDVGVADDTEVSTARKLVTPILLGLAVLVMVVELFIGQGGFIEVEPGEVGVVYNNTGLPLFGPKSQVVIDQGAKTFIPGVQSVHLLEISPQVVVMAAASRKQGSRTYGRRARRSPPLTVRAKDGSNFYFDRLEIFYQVIPSAASNVFATSGPKDAYKESLVAVHAREILRDEFGRYSFLAVANPATYDTANGAAKRRLNERLAPYGLEVTQIITPKPKFEDRVERAIEERQNAEQEEEVQEEKRRKLEQEKGLKIQSIIQEKNAEYQGLVAQLEAEKKAAQNGLLAAKREAEKYFIEREAAGKAYRDEKITQAKANEVAYRKAAEALVAKITAVGAEGPDVLNRVIAEKVFPQLERIRATPRLEPVSPIDIRHVQGAPPARRGLSRRN